MRTEGSQSSGWLRRSSWVEVGFLTVLILLISAIRVLPQTDTGELRITVRDTAGLPAPGPVELTSEVNQYRRNFDTDQEGHLDIEGLPFGPYHVEVTRRGFVPVSDLVEIRSAIPKELNVVLSGLPAKTAITVKASETLIDQHRTDTVNRIGGDVLEDRTAATPGRSIADLVNMEPGWLFEANGVLHPRGSEYQVQYVIDGMPLTDNRSPAFLADLNGNDVSEISVRTAGYPAEFGRKLGGVIEIDTARDNRQGFHGRAVASGGSFDTGEIYAEGQDVWGRNAFTLSAGGSTTDRFLDPPVLQNYTNHGTTADLMGHYERDLNNTNRIGIIFRRGQSRFLVPNEIVQENAGQRQDRDNYETAVQLSYEHVFSSNAVASFGAMARDIGARLWSNPFSTPMIAGQDRGYREAYVRGTVSIHHGAHEIKVGAAYDLASVREAMSYQITDPTQFAPDTPPMFSFLGRAPDREPAAFAQDLVRLKDWTFSAGLRYDHYRLLVKEGAWSPRLGIAWYWPAANLVFRASYDRVFETPAFENLLVSSSPQVSSLSNQVLRLPVQPSHGNFYEAGLAKSLFGKLRFDTNLYRRDFTNYADDDVLLNTGISFPIAFAKATIYGEEVKLEIPKWGRFSGFASYSNMLGKGYFPVTGGLFLGDNALQAVSATSGEFPVSQDQRNTVRALFHSQITRRVWAAIGGTYDSGLPVDFDGTYQQAAAEYGQEILDRVNFSDYRARPGFTINASAGVILKKTDKDTVRLQLDILNLTNELNVIDFAGLFSGTAIAAPRSVDCRLQFDF